MNNAKDTVEKLYKGNGKLYFACLFVGLITGAIVSCYRWGLEKIGIFRKAYFSDVSLNNPVSLLKVWLIFIDVYKRQPDDKSKTSNSLGKSLLLKFIDYILGANNDDKIVPKVLNGYKLIALVEFKNIEYEVIRILGDTKRILINEEAYELTEYKKFFKIDRTLFRNQIILTTRKNLINSYSTNPNKEEMISFLKLIGINPVIIEDTDKIYSIQDEIKNLKNSKKEFLVILDELEEKKIKEQVFYLEKEIKKLEDSLKEIDNKIKNIQITDIKKDIIEEYTRKRCV